MKIHGHDHEIEFYVGFLNCDVCHDRSFYDIVVHCPDCKFNVHSKCILVFSIVETTEHPSHVGHHLKLLTTGSPDHTDPKCHICNKDTKRLLYHCSKCNLNMDVDCMVDGMCAQAHLNMPWHHHPLLTLHFGYEMRCEICGLDDGFGYFCHRCKLLVHEKCVTVFDPLEINHPLHAKHSLKLLTDGAPSYTDPTCHVCAQQAGILLYHCDICKFNLDIVCAIEHHAWHKTTPAILSNMKVHEHTLKLIPRMISFVCDACGGKGNRSPYVCLDLQCDLMFFHQDCASLPRVINVNRHDHRVSYKYPIGVGEWECGICLETIDWSYGAYSCSLCPNYTLHSKCATSKDVWDGKELDGVPEEVEDIEPFKMNDDNTITHFAHPQHSLSLNKDDKSSDESVLCGACARPIGSDTFYSCSDCSFVLHETCANLPKKKRHFLSPTPLILVSNEDNNDIECSACMQMCCTGFMYFGEYGRFDLICSSTPMPFVHGSHPHPLLYYELPTSGDEKICPSCEISVRGELVLGCMKCNYFLHFRCATMPQVKLQRYDDHPLTPSYGEKASGKYWCDICERETNPETWFYTCSKDCGVTLHTFCVLGNVRYAKPGGKIKDGYELVFNNTSSRPLCDHCHCRCAAPFFLVKQKGIFCSYYCTMRIQKSASWVNDARNVICPPWVART